MANKKSQKTAPLSNVSQASVAKQSDTIEGAITGGSSDKKPSNLIDLPEENEGDLQNNDDDQYVDSEQEDVVKENEMQGQASTSARFNAVDGITIDPRSAKDKDAALVALVSKLFLGFAMVDFATPLWEQVSIGPWNTHPLVEKEAMKLCNSLALEGIQIMSYPMNMAIGKNDVIKGTIVSKISQGGSHPLDRHRAALLRSPGSLQGENHQGSHQSDLRQKGIGKDELYEEEGTKSKRGRKGKGPVLYSKPPPGSVAECDHRIADMEGRKPALKQWLVRFYDKDGGKGADHATDLLLKKGDGMVLGVHLVSNRILYQYKVTEDETCTLGGTVSRGISGMREQQGRQGIAEEGGGSEIVDSHKMMEGTLWHANHETAKVGSQNVWACRRGMGHPYRGLHGERAENVQIYHSPLICPDIREVEGKNGAVGGLRGCGNKPPQKACRILLTTMLLSAVVDHWERVELGVKEMGAWLETFISSFGLRTNTRHEGGILTPASEMMIDDAAYLWTISQQDMIDQFWEWNSSILRILHQAMVTHERARGGSATALDTATAKSMFLTVQMWLTKKVNKEKLNAQPGAEDPGKYPSSNPFVPSVIEGTIEMMIDDAAYLWTISQQDMIDQFWEWNSSILRILHQAMVTHERARGGSATALDTATAKSMFLTVQMWLTKKVNKEKLNTQPGAEDPGKYPSSNPFVPSVIEGTIGKNLPKIVTKVAQAVVLRYDESLKLWAMMNEFLEVCQVRQWIAKHWKPHSRLALGVFRDQAGVEGSYDFEEQTTNFGKVFALLSKTHGFEAVDPNNPLETIPDPKVMKILKPLGLRMRFNHGQRLLAKYRLAADPDEDFEASEDDKPPPSKCFKGKGKAISKKQAASLDQSPSLPPNKKKSIKEDRGEGPSCLHELQRPIPESVKRHMKLTMLSRKRITEEDAQSPRGTKKNKKKTITPAAGTELRKKDDFNIIEPSAKLVTKGKGKVQPSSCKVSSPPNNSSSEEEEDENEEDKPEEGDDDNEDKDEDGEDDDVHRHIDEDDDGNDDEDTHLCQDGGMNGQDRVTGSAEQDQVPSNTDWNGNNENMPPASSAAPDDQGKGTQGNILVNMREMRMDVEGEPPKDDHSQTLVVFIDDFGHETGPSTQGPTLPLEMTQGGRDTLATVQCLDVEEKAKKALRVKEHNEALQRTKKKLASIRSRNTKSTSPIEVTGGPSTPFVKDTIRRPAPARPGDGTAKFQRQPKVNQPKKRAPPGVNDVTMKEQTSGALTMASGSSKGKGKAD
ncbi:hypothetical protein K439DRAFT_1624619 [Ramaria rubella]|nr:hypothetical protein K439DRAFT_1624619 [Ramaria rubella]